MFKLRGYQAEVDSRLDQTPGHPLIVLPTGAGKTVLFAHRLAKHTGKAFAIAHRQELVYQISLALAREGVMHSIEAPSNVIKLCKLLHNQELGRNFYFPESKTIVAGVDTIGSRASEIKRKHSDTTLVCMDEAHHILRTNKWGKAVSLFPEARTEGYTATPHRSDGKGLGAHADGVFTDLIESVDMGWLIENGFLTPYKIYAPDSHIKREAIPVGASGEFVQSKLSTAVRESTIIGDVPDHYLKFAAGKLGITFAPDVATAQLISDRFNLQGVPSAVIHAKTPAKERYNLLRKYKNREYLQLVNVDIFGEGFDLPAIECVSFARPTMSFNLFVQQFGRGLRILTGKTHATIIDHVGNTLYHAKTMGLPDSKIYWTLDRREKKSSDKPVLLLTVCKNPLCNRPYERFRKACPYCGYISTPAVRSAPEFVDGDLSELSPEILNSLRNKQHVIDMNDDEYTKYLGRSQCPRFAVKNNLEIHKDTQSAQALLREAMQWWGGLFPDLSVIEIQKKFFLAFGCDVLSAQGLNKKEATILTTKIWEDFQLCLNTNALNATMCS